MGHEGSCMKTQVVGRAAGTVVLVHVPVRLNTLSLDQAGLYMGLSHDAQSASFPDNASRSCPGVAWLNLSCFTSSVRLCARGFTEQHS